MRQQAVNELWKGDKFYLVIVKYMGFIAFLIAPTKTEDDPMMMQRQGVILVVFHSYR